MPSIGGGGMSLTDANRYIKVYYRMFLDDFVKYATDPKFMGAELVELTP